MAHLSDLVNTPFPSISGRPWPTLAGANPRRPAPGHGRSCPCHPGWNSPAPLRGQARLRRPGRPGRSSPALPRRRAPPSRPAVVQARAALTSRAPAPRSPAPPRGHARPRRPRPRLRRPDLTYAAPSSRPAWRSPPCANLAGDCCARPLAELAAQDLAGVSPFVGQRLRKRDTNFF
jgi:hypothetical protein